MRKTLQDRNYSRNGRESWQRLFQTSKLAKAYASVSSSFAMAALTILIVFGFANSASAQYTYVPTYVVDGGNPNGTNTNSDSYISGYTAIGTTSAATNTWSSTYALPFTFNFYGSPVTHFKVSGNGVVTFDTTAVNVPADSNTSLPATGSNIPDKSILGFWDSFTGSAPTGSNDQIWVGIEGTAPNRQAWIKYYSYEYGSTGSSQVASFAYWAIVLEEGTDKIYIVDMNYHSNGANLTSTIGVQNNSLSAVEYGNSAVGMGAGSTGNADNDYYEFSPILLVNDNAGIASIDAPVSPLSTGVQNVDVTIKNFGLNTLTSATINWKVNGVLQTPYSFVGSLGQDATSLVTIGSYNFLSGTSTVEVWTSLPNGNTDNDTSNDSAMVSLCTSLSGSYTVGGLGADYADVASAAAALNSCGISGAVTFNVSAGTYAGGFFINEVAGASSTNTIAFIGANAATTTISHDGTGQNATILFDGADHVTFQNFTIANTATSNGWGVQFTNQADNNTIDSCVVNVDLGTNSSVVPVLATGSTTSVSSTGNNANNTTISNSTLNGGYYGVRFYGSSSGASDNSNNTVDNCVINSYYYGLYYYYQDAPVATGNTVNLSNTSSGYGLYCGYSRHMNFSGNTILEARTYALYVWQSNGSSQNATARFTIANNMITALSSGDGIYITSSNDFDIFYNSITAENDQALWLSSSASGYDIRNNIFAASGTSQVIDLDANPGLTDVINYNVYYHSAGGDIAIMPLGTFSTLAAWQLADLVNNVNSLEGDPSFFSATDLHLAGTIADNAGVPILSITTDIDGDTRSLTTPDIGADEYTAPSCSPPGSLTATALATTADLGWTAGGTETMWDVEYDTVGFTQGLGTLVVNTTSNPYTATSLTPQTDYEFYVRAKCGGSSSPWIGPLSFTTACLPATAPFTENFDGLALSSPYTDLPACWEPQVGPDWWDVTNGSTNSPFYLSGFVDHTTGTGNFMWIDASSDITANEMVTPLIDMSSLTTPFAGFWFGSNNITNATNHTISLDAWDGTAWVNVATERGNFANWVEVSGPVPAGVPSTTKFRIYAIADTGTTGSTYYQNDLGVDDFFVMEAPSCIAPTMLSAYNSTTTSVDVYWTGGGATDYNYEYGAVGFAPGSGTYMSSTNDTVTLSSLTAATSYDVYVRDSCGTGNVSPWVGPLTVNTLVCPVANQCMFTINMTDAYGDGWNGGSVSFEINGIEVGEVGSGFTSGSTYTDSVSLCDMDSVKIIMKNAGSFSYEIGFDVLNPQGIVIFSQAATTSGNGASTGDVLGTIYAQCATPSCPVTDIPVASSMTSCGPVPVTFTASGSTNPMQEYIWLRASDSAVVGTGSSFTTPPVTATTDYFVTIGARDDVAGQQHVGPLTNIAAAGYGNFSNGQFFRAFDSFVIDSMTVNSNGGVVAFQVRISEQLSGGAGTEIMRSDTITVVGAGDHQVAVNLPITPGSYFINLSFITAQTTGALFRATSGAVYPYTISNLVSIDSVNFSGARYYYSFDWVVSEVCSSPLTAITATAGATPSTAFPYMEDFNAGLPCNWSTMALTTGTDWMNTTYRGSDSLNGTPFMLLDDDAAGSSAITEASLMSPVFNAQGYDTLFMEFDHYFRSLTGSSGNVEVWDGTQWVNIATFTSTVGAWGTPAHEMYDVTMYQNTDFQVRFRYDDGSSYAWYWGVDNFELDGIQTPCQNVVVDLTTDIYGSEISWSIVDTATGTVYASGGPYLDVSPYNAAAATHIDTVCLPFNTFFEFRLEDSYGDGLFDGTNTGTFTVDILCPWGNNNVIMGSGALTYGSTTNSPAYDSVVFEVSCIIPCADPDSLMSVAACTTADLSWSSDTAGGTSTIEYGITGFALGTGTTVNNAVSTQTISNLMMGTTYDWYVMDTCSGGTATNWVGPETFTTDTMPKITITSNLVSVGDTVTYSFSVTSGGANATVSWDFGDNSPLGSGLNTSHDYLANGPYTVTCVVTNNCGSDSATVTVLVEGIGLDEYGFGNLELYPNPNNGVFSISGISAFGDKTTIEIVSLTGVTIYKKDVIASSQESFNVDVSGMAPGVYQVRVSSNKGVSVRAFVLRN